MGNYDIVISGGRVVDGSGNPWFYADIGISDGKIVDVGRLNSSSYDMKIDAEGLIVSPGFIDMHSHDDLVFFWDRFNKPKIHQGVTTVVIGNCGLSPAPVNNKTLDILKSYLGIIGKNIVFKWNSYGEFLDILEDIGCLGTNIAGLVGHGTLRIAVMGMSSSLPTTDELNKMKKLLSESLVEGAFGMSTGLIYPPGVYSNTEELIELSKVLYSYNGLYATHMRNEGRKLIEAVSEAIRIGKEAGVSVEISHHKAAGRSNWGKSEETIRLIEEARDDGVEVTADAYPYTAGSTYLASILPSWAHEKGEEYMKNMLNDESMRIKIRMYIDTVDDEWENMVKENGWKSIYLTRSLNFDDYVGKNIKEISEDLDKDPFDVVFDILSVDGYNADMIIFSMDEDDVDRIITRPYVMIGTDGLDTGVGNPHPRAYGTFPRFLHRYVIQKKRITLEEAIRKMSSLPARKLRLNKGLLFPGFDADIVIFDPHVIKDKASYQDPRKYPEGIKYVIVNGVISVEHGVLTGDTGGEVIRR